MPITDISTSNIRGPAGPIAFHGINARDTNADGKPLEERLVKHVVAIRDRAFDPVMLRDLATALIGTDNGLPADSDGDAAHTALAEILRPFCEPAREKPFVPSAMYPAIPERIYWHIMSFDSKPTPDLRDATEFWIRHFKFTTPDGKNYEIALDVSLLRFTNDCLRAYPALVPEDFFRPFLDLAQRDMLSRHEDDCYYSFPNGLGEGLEKGLIPFERFRQLAAACGREVEQKTSDSRYKMLSYLVCDPYTPASSELYWYTNLHALFSFTAMALLAHGRVTLDTLISWLGMDARLRAHDPVLPPQWVDPPQWANNVAHFLLACDKTELALKETRRRYAFTSKGGASHVITSFDQPDAPGESIVRRIGALENPEVIPLLANAWVPLSHAIDLLSHAGKVNWLALESEIKRVAAVSHEERVQAVSDMEEIHLKADYDSDMSYDSLDSTDWEKRETIPGHHGIKTFYRRTEQRSELTTAEDRCWEESERNLAPHIQLEALRSHERLREWKLATENKDGRTLLTEIVRPASALLSLWRSQNIPVDQQVWLSRFLIQGFDQAWARDVVLSGAPDPARLQAWFADSPDPDLSAYLDDTMKAATVRWLNDGEISVERLEQAPKMIQCRLSANQIEHLLRSPALPKFDILPLYFETATELVRYGMISIDELNEGATLSVSFPVLHYELDNFPPLRREMGDTLEHLRRSLLRLETVQAALAPDSPHAGRCEALANSWRHAISRLDALLQPLLEKNLAESPEQVEEDLKHLSSDLLDQLWKSPVSVLAMQAQGSRGIRPGPVVEDLKHPFSALLHPLSEAPANVLAAQPQAVRGIKRKRPATPS